MARVKDCVEKAMQVKIRERYDLTASQGQEIYDAYKADPAGMIYTAFRFGYLQGQKSQCAADKERNKK